MGDPSTAVQTNSSASSFSRSTPITFSHPISSKLDNNNFLVWRRQILATVRGYRLQEFLFNSARSPSRFLSPEDELLRVVNPEFLEWEQQDQLLVSWMLASMTDSVLARMVNCETAAQVWSTIEVLDPLPIGFAVFVVHLATVPSTGTGINPARSFGAAVIYNNDKIWDYHGQC